MGNEIGREWSVVIGAPILTGLTVLAVIAIVWGVMYFLYRHRNEALNESLRREQAETVRLRGRLAEFEKGAPAKLAAEPAPPTPDLAIARNKLTVIREMQRIATNGRQILNRTHGVSSGVNEILPRAEAALLSARKTFEVRIPEPSPIPSNRLGHAIVLFDKIVPLLSAGHIQEAREKAEEICKIADETTAQLRADGISGG
jgi:hypothetical protein